MYSEAPVKANTLTIQDIRSKCLKSFAYFCNILQDSDFMFDVHVDLCEHLQYCVDHMKSPRGMTIMPRGSMKSTFGTKFFSMWLACRNPNVRVIIVMNSSNAARSKLREIKQEFEDNKTLEALFPELIPDFNKVKWSDESACLNRTGKFPESTFTAAGTRTTLTSFHYDFIIEDDTVAPDLDDLSEEMIMPSREDIEQAIGWHRSATPLMIDPFKGGRFVIGTRWCFDDLLEWIEKNQTGKNGYRIFNRKAIEFGKTITPKLHLEALDSIKDELGSFMFNALYLNDPMRPDDMPFRAEWLHWYSELVDSDEEELTPSWVITCDPAISDSDSACDTAIIRASHHEGQMFVDRAVGGKITPLKTASMICDLIMLDYENTKEVCVEINAYQKALALILRDEFAKRNIFKPIREIRSKTNKDIRIMALSPLMENGQIAFFGKEDGAGKRIPGIGIETLRTQILQYPHGKLVDYLDALAMQVEAYHGLRRPIIRKKKVSVDHTNPTFEQAYSANKKDRQNSYKRLRTGLRTY